MLAQTTECRICLGSQWENWTVPRLPVCERACMCVCACVSAMERRGGGMVVDSVGGALKPVSTSVSATLIAYGGIDLWWVQGHCTRSSCLPTLASRQGPVNFGCG